MSLSKAVTGWFFCALCVAGAVAVCMRWFDVTIARIFVSNSTKLASLGTGLGSAVLVSGEMVVMAVLIAVRFVSGRLPSPAKTTLVAIVASLVTYSINESVFKLFFGLPSPELLLFYGSDHNFHYFRGGENSSFPSGHMALAASFVFALSHIRRREGLILQVALLIAGGVLIVGDWHYLSDVLAGAFVGAVGGRTAGALWAHHQKIFNPQHSRNAL
jgi:membrane-associated phospholipid phosphatase